MSSLLHGEHDPYGVHRRPIGENGNGMQQQQPYDDPAAKGPRNTGGGGGGPSLATSLVSRFLLFVIVAGVVTGTVVAFIQLSRNNAQDDKDMALMGNVSDLDVRVTALESNVTDLDGRVTALENVDNTALLANISALENKTSINMMDIAALQTKTTGNMDNITALQLGQDMILSMIPNSTNSSVKLTELMMDVITLETEALTHFEDGYGTTMSISPTPTPTGVGRTIRTDLDVAEGTGISITPAPSPTPGPVTIGVNSPTATPLICANPACASSIAGEPTAGPTLAPAICGNSNCSGALAMEPTTGPTLAPVICADAGCPGEVVNGITGSPTITGVLSLAVCPLCYDGTRYRSDIGPDVKHEADGFLNVTGSTTSGLQGARVRGVSTNALEVEIDPALTIPNTAAHPTFVPTFAPALAPSICASPTCVGTGVTQFTPNVGTSPVTPLMGDVDILGSGSAGLQGARVRGLSNALEIEMDPALYIPNLNAHPTFVPTIAPTLAPNICASPACANPVLSVSGTGITGNGATGGIVESMPTGNIDLQILPYTSSGVPFSQAAHWCIPGRAKNCATWTTNVHYTKLGQFMTITTTEITSEFTTGGGVPCGTTFNLIILCAGVATGTDICGTGGGEVCTRISTTAMPNPQSAGNAPRGTIAYTDDGNNRDPFAYQLTTGGYITAQVRNGPGTLALGYWGGLNMIYAHGL